MRIGPWCALAIGMSLLTAVPASSGDQPQWEWRQGAWAPAVRADESTPAGELALIRQRLDAGRNRKAVSAARSFLSKYPDAPEREEAMTLAGEAEMNRQRYWQAYEWYEQQLEEFPAGTFSDRALRRQYDIGQAFLEGKPRIVLGLFVLPAQSEGLEILSRVAEHAPGAAIAEQALMRIGDYHYEKADYVEAADSYDRYLQLFARGRYVPQATLKAADATLLSLRSVSYDLTPLVEAADRFGAFQERFPAHARQAQVAQTLDAIESLKAQSDYETGEFYRRMKRDGAAAFYFKQVIQRYPLTDWAVKARDRLLAMGAAQALEPPAGASGSRAEEPAGPASPQRPSQKDGAE